MTTLANPSRVPLPADLRPPKEREALPDRFNGMAVYADDTAQPCQSASVGRLTYIRIVLNPGTTGRIKLRYFERRYDERQARESGVAYFQPRLCRQVIESLKSRADVRVDVVAPPGLLEALHLTP